MAEKFQISMESIGVGNEVLVRVFHDHPAFRVEFAGATSAAANKAVYPVGETVRFRFVTDETQTEWMTALAMKPSISMASRFGHFDRGA